MEAYILVSTSEKAVRLDIGEREKKFGKDDLLCLSGRVAMLRKQNINL